jgi:hypothetical protein
MASPQASSDAAAAGDGAAYSTGGRWSVPQNGHWNVPSSAEVAPSSGNRTFDWAAWRSLESKTLTTRLHDTHGINRVNNTDARVPLGWLEPGRQRVRVFRAEPGTLLYGRTWD